MKIPFLTILSLVSCTTAIHNEEVQNSRTSVLQQHLRGGEDEDLPIFGKIGKWVSCTSVCTTFFVDGNAKKCGRCLKSLIDTTLPTVGINGLPISYSLDMLSLKLPGNTYVKAWCGQDTTEGCTEKPNFPGHNSTSVNDWDDVWKLGQSMPAKQFNGQIWRGNELGFIINNGYFWSKTGIKPMGLTLGATVNQHLVLRPWIDAVLGTSGLWKSAEIDSAVVAFLREKQANNDGIAAQDLKKFVHFILIKIVFQGKLELTDEEVTDFVALQSKVVGLATVSQIFPAFMYSGIAGKAVGMPETANNMATWVNRYKPFIEQLYSDMYDGKDCSPAPDCPTLLAQACFDFLYAAGGLSVPGGLSTALGVLYSTDESNPFAARTYDPETESTRFFYESLRYFAPVVGFPYWTTRPTCPGMTAEETAAVSNKEDCPVSDESSGVAGFEKHNQYLGGTRVIPNLAVAQMSVAKWGMDASEFKIRSLQEYKDNFVGFAEMAYDPNTANGAMSRNCPAKGLALAIGSSFFKQFTQSDWVAKDANKIKFTGSTPFVSDFTLYYKEIPAKPSGIDNILSGLAGIFRG